MYTLNIYRDGRDTKLEVSMIDEEDEVYFSITRNEEEVAHYINREEAIALIEFLKHEFKL